MYSATWNRWYCVIYLPPGPFPVLLCLKIFAPVFWALLMVYIWQSCIWVLYWKGPFVVRREVGRYISKVVQIFLPPANEVCEGYVFTGVCLSTLGGHAWFYSGGMCGFIWGVCMVLFGGHVWFYSGGHVWFYSGGMHSIIWGACMVLFGGHAWFFRGACMVFSVFLDTMRYGQWAGGTHPTGMHSSLSNVQVHLSHSHAYLSFVNLFTEIKLKERQCTRYLM